jgi:hypothetical protein
MKMDFNKLIEITAKDKTSDMGFLQWSQFIFWIAISQIIFLFPLVILTIGFGWFLK